MILPSKFNTTFHIVKIDQVSRVAVVFIIIKVERFLPAVSK